jgi:hypothetical protein
VRKTTKNHTPTTADHLARFRRSYESGNALALWRAIWEARTDGKRLQPWMLNALEDIASDLLELAARGRDKDPHIVAALGLKKMGRGTVMTRERQAMYEALISMEVANAHARGQTLETAYATVAEAWGIESEDTVRAIYRRRPGRQRSRR